MGRKCPWMQSMAAKEAPTLVRPPSQYTAAGMTEKLVWIDAITQRPAMR